MSALDAVGAAEYRVLSLWQPWASLVALGVKTIETRSWSTKYRGPLAIHAAARKPTKADLGPHGWIGAYSLGLWCDEVHHVLDEDGECDCDGDENVLGRCAAGSDLRPALLNDEGAHGWSLGTYLPLGVIVARCTLTDVVPMVGPGEEGAIRTLDIDDNGSLWIAGPVEDEENDPQDWREVTDQRPYGDFTPGRFAWLLDEITPLPAPVPFRGGQGLTRKWTS
jgi:hypothetical protein